MVNAAATAKYPAALLTTEDVGVFGNNEVTLLDTDAAIADTTLSVLDADAFEVHQWIALRGPDGFELAQVDAVDAEQDNLTVERAKDGTVAVAHKEGQEIRGVIPAIALNQMRVDLIATQTKLGATATSGTEGGILFADASGNFAQDATNLFWHDADNQLRLAATGSSAGILIGGDTQLYRGAADRLDLASGDSFNIVLGALQIAGATVFESDRDFAVDLIPNADNSLDVGSSARRLAEAVSNSFLVYASAGDANPVLKATSAGLEMGAGGASALDVLWERSAADTWRTPDSVVIAGDLTVQGTTTTLDTTNTTIKDNVIVLNDGEAGAGVTAGESGLEIDRGSLDNAFLLFDETEDRFRVSYDNDATRVTLAEQAIAGAFTAGSILFADANGRLQEDNANLFWDDAANRLDVSSVAIINSGAGADPIFTSASGGQNLDLAGGLRPSADNSFSLGASSLRWVNIDATAHRVFAGSGDAIPSALLVASTLEFGPGGASSRDVAILRGDANRLDLGANDHLQLAAGDVRFDDATKGIILKDTQATPHYWRVTIDTSGTLVTTDLGTSLPST